MPGSLVSTSATQSDQHTGSTPEVASRRRSGQPLSFAAAVLALVTCFVASAAPLPLYNTYRAANGVTTADLSLTVVAYSWGRSRRCCASGGSRPTWDVAR